MTDTPYTTAAAAIERAAQIAQHYHDEAAKWAAVYLKSFDGKTDSKAIADAIKAIPVAPDPRIAELQSQIGKLSNLLDAQLGTPCEQIRHEQAVEEKDQRCAELEAFCVGIRDDPSLELSLRHAARAALKAGDT